MSPFQGFCICVSYFPAANAAGYTTKPLRGKISPILYPKLRLSVFIEYQIAKVTKSWDDSCTAAPDSVDGAGV
jgi:hypothetical protein